MIWWERRRERERERGVQKKSREDLCETRPYIDTVLNIIYSEQYYKPMCTRTSARVLHPSDTK